MKFPFKKPLILWILFAFVVNTFGPLPASAQEITLPKPGEMVHLSTAVNPPILKGLKVHPDNPFRFDFILDQGEQPDAISTKLKEDSTRLIKYFLASLTIPEVDLWVNLSPYEKDRIIPNSFGLTEMGRDLLAQDYMLKQITASLIYPEAEVGKRFWKRIYEEAAKRYGNTNIPVNTFNKVWIVPEKAVVYENAKAETAYVVESRLKVMLEEDYLSKAKNDLQSKANSPSLNASNLGSQIIREIVLPELIKEVNEGANFAQLRQVYSSLILATWYKKKIKDSILSQVYSDKNKVSGIDINDPAQKDKIYQQYIQAFKKGVYNYIKEEIDPATQQAIPRKYFSGGAKFGNLAMTTTNQFPQVIPAGLVAIQAEIKSSNPEGKTNAAMIAPLTAGEKFVSELDDKIILDGQGRIRYAAGHPTPIVKPLFTFLAERHGETFANLDERAQGVADENHLNESTPHGLDQGRDSAKGLFQRADIQEMIRKRIPIVVLTSGKKRTTQAAEPFIRRVEEAGGIIEYAPEELMKGASEINFGAVENKKLSHFSPEEIEILNQYRKQLSATAKFKGGESFLELLIKIKKWLEELNRLYAGRTVVLFGHGTQLKAVQTLLGDPLIVDPSGYINRNAYVIPNGKIIELHSPAMAAPAIKSTFDGSALKYSSDSIIQNAPEFERVDMFLDWYKANREKLPAKDGYREFLSASYTANVLMHAGKITIERLEEFQREAGAYEYGQESAVIQNAPEFDDVEKFLKWYDDKHEQLRSKDHPEEFLSRSYTFQVLRRWGKIKQKKFQSILRHIISYEYAQESIVIKHAPKFEDVEAYLKWYRTNREQLPFKDDPKKFLTAGSVVMALMHAGKIDKENFQDFQRHVGAYEYAQESEIILSAPEFNDVGYFLKWFRTNGEKLRSKENPEIFISASYAALCLMYARKIKREKLEHFQRQAGAYEYAQESAIIQSAPEFNEISEFIKWYRANRVLLRSKEHPEESLSGSYTAQVLMHAGKIPSERLTKFQLHVGAYQRAIDEEKIITAEMQRIWKESIHKELSGLPRIKAAFNPQLLLNKRISKGPSKPLGAEYRNLILTYAYEYYGEKEEASINPAMASNLGNVSVAERASYLVYRYLLLALYQLRGSGEYLDRRAIMDHLMKNSDYKREVFNPNSGWVDINFRKTGILGVGLIIKMPDEKKFKLTEAGIAFMERSYRLTGDAFILALKDQQKQYAQGSIDSKSGEDPVELVRYPKDFNILNKVKLKIAIADSVVQKTVDSKLQYVVNLEEVIEKYSEGLSPRYLIQAQQLSKLIEKQLVAFGFTKARDMGLDKSNLYSRDRSYNLDLIANPNIIRTQDEINFEPYRNFLLALHRLNSEEIKDSYSPQEVWKKIQVLSREMELQVVFSSVTAKQLKSAYESMAQRGVLLIERTEKGYRLSSEGLKFMQENGNLIKESLLKALKRHLYDIEQYELRREWLRLPQAGGTLNNAPTGDQVYKPKLLSEVEFRSIEEIFEASSHPEVGQWLTSQDIVAFEGHQIGKDRILKALKSPFRTSLESMGLANTVFYPVKVNQPMLIQKDFEQLISKRKDEGNFNILIYQIGLGEEGFLETRDIFNALKNAFHQAGISQEDQQKWKVTFIGVDVIKTIVDDFIQKFSVKTDFQSNILTIRADALVEDQMRWLGEKFKSDYLFFRNVAYGNYRASRGHLKSYINVVETLAIYLGTKNILKHLSVPETRFVIEPAQEFENTQNYVFHAPGTRIVTLKHYDPTKEFLDLNNVINTGTGIYKVLDPGAMDREGLQYFLDHVTEFEKPVADQAQKAPSLSSYSTLKLNDRSNLSMTLIGSNPGSRADYIKVGNRKDYKYGFTREELLQREAALMQVLSTDQRYNQIRKYLPVFKGLGRLDISDVRNVIPRLPRRSSIPDVPPRFFQEEDFLGSYMVTEDAGDPIYAIANEVREGKLTEDDLLKTMSLLVQSIYDFHHAGIAFGDLTPDEIFIAPSTEKVTIIDYGLAMIDEDRDFGYENLKSFGLDRWEGRSDYGGGGPDWFKRDVRTVLTILDAMTPNSKFGNFFISQFNIETVLKDFDNNPLSISDVLSKVQDIERQWYEHSNAAMTAKLPVGVVQYWRDLPKPWESTLERYPSHHQTLMDRMDAITKRVRKFAQGKAITLTEICCGTGKLFASLVQLPGVTKAVAIDINAKALDSLKDRLHGIESKTSDISVFEGDINGPLAKDIVPNSDVIVINDALMHMPDLEKVLDLVAERLSEGGLFMGSGISREGLFKETPILGPLWYVGYRFILPQFERVGLGALANRVVQWESLRIRLTAQSQREIKEMLGKRFDIEEITVKGRHYQFTVRKKDGKIEDSAQISEESVKTPENMVKVPVTQEELVGFIGDIRTKMQAIYARSNDPTNSSYWHVFDEIVNTYKEEVNASDNQLKMFADLYTETSLIGPLIPRPKEAKHVLLAMAMFLMLANHRKENVYTSEVFNELRNLIDDYNKQSFVTFPFSLSSLFVIALTPYFHDPDLFVELWNKLDQLPDDISPQAKFLSMFSVSAHLGVVRVDGDDDFKIIYQKIEGILADKSHPDQIPDSLKRVLLNSIAKVLPSIYHPNHKDVYSGFHRMIGWSSGFREKFLNLLTKHKDLICDIYYEYFSNSDTTDDPILAGLGFSFYLKAEKELLSKVLRDKILQITGSQQLPPLNVLISDSRFHEILKESPLYSRLKANFFIKYLRQFVELKEDSPTAVGIEDQQSVSPQPGSSPAMAVRTEAKQGGVDFTANKTPLEVQNVGGDIQFHIDLAMMKQLQAAPGFYPVIMNITPLKDLKVFLDVETTGRSSLQ